MAVKLEPGMELYLHRPLDSEYYKEVQVNF